MARLTRVNGTLPSGRQVVAELPDDSTVHRTFQRCVRLGGLERI
jgi:hypothetical protein